MNSSRLPAALALATAIAASAALVSFSPASAAVNPCAIVTTAEASAAMGVTSLPPKVANHRHASCRWYSPNHQMNVFVQAIDAGDMTGAMQLGGKSLPGIGDSAVWAGGSLFIKKGGNYAQVALYLTAKSMEKMDPALLKLGKAAAGRM